MCALATVCKGQADKHNVFLFVHGAWGGGWEYQKLDSILTAQGNVVIRPTLTGVGERNHLFNSRVNLTTHINDIVNVIEFENLYNIILVGHSYGGMVISGVAERIPEHIKQLIYLDAFVPENGESVQSIQGSVWDITIKPLIKEGLIGYPFGQIKLKKSRDVPQPLGSFTEPINIENPLVSRIQTSFILMIKDGKAPFEQWGAIRARARGWEVFRFEGGHYPMRDQPEELVKKIQFVIR